MKFTQNSQIRCFAHILNLVMKTILRSLHASSHKEACDLLDDVAKKSWKIDQGTYFTYCKASTTCPLDCTISSANTEVG